MIKIDALELARMVLKVHRDFLLENGSMRIDKTTDEFIDEWIDKKIDQNTPRI